MENILTATSELPELEALNDIFFSFIPGIKEARPVPVVAATHLTARAFHNDWVSKNKPCLVKGAVKDWPAVTAWRNKDYWRAACENFNIRVYLDMNHNSPELHRETIMPFHDAIDRLFARRDAVFSMPSERIEHNGPFSALLKEMNDFPFVSPQLMPRMYEHRRLFLYRKAATAWHYHNIDETLMCQVNGAKKVVLLSPRIPRPEFVTRFLNDEWYLQGKLLDPALKLNPYTVTVEEGDALYIPPYWHHGVVPADTQIGFTLAYCWKSPWHILGDFSNYFVRDLYKKAIWPLNRFTPFLPFLGCYAGMSLLWRKMRGL
jgi:dTDP-4-dehydrorhamnose 3,5-epimerase-like enzyme